MNPNFERVARSPALSRKIIVALTVIAWLITIPFLFVWMSFKDGVPVAWRDLKDCSCWGDIRKMWRGIPLILASLGSLLFTSCSVIPTPGGQYAMMLGGKGHLEYGPGGTMAYTYSNEKSFHHATQALVAVAGSMASASVSKAKEVTTQQANASAAKTAQQKIAADAATEQARINAQSSTIQAVPEAVKPAGTTLNAP